MVQLELTVEEQEGLRKALESYLSDLRTEIADTEAHSMLEELKDEEKMLKQVLGRLGSVTKEPE